MRIIVDGSGWEMDIEEGGILWGLEWGVVL